jgi:hypothetical protein
MPGPSAREGKPAVGTTSAEWARAPAAARVAEGYRPWRWIPASCRNDGNGGRTYDQGRSMDCGQLISAGRAIALTFSEVSQ